MLSCFYSFYLMISGTRVPERLSACQTLVLFFNTYVSPKAEVHVECCVVYKNSKDLEVSERCYSLRHGSCSTGLGLKELHVRVNANVYNFIYLC